MLNESLTVAKGLFVEKVEPQSLADKAGIREKDVIAKVNDKPVANNFDLEFALFESLEQENVTITIHTEDKGEITIELSLRK